MTNVAIGIQVYEEPEGLLATLESLRAHTGRDVEILLLPDGPDPAVAAALADLAGLPQYGTSEPLGMPACFNRLARETTAGVIVLLESGARVGPGWLDHLLAALDADPRHGLAGPSTNTAWNEQRAFPHAGTSPAEVTRAAEEAARRFGRTWRTLAPLYSLGDFCYAVRREVVEAIGPADEGYGLGPCWEMDYNIRAARAGFHGVWAGAAYVARSPFTPRRRREEALRFEPSKRRYQDKFCGARLRGEKLDYRPHCRGDACPNFAPIVPDTPAPIPSALAPPIAITPLRDSEPLVSCIMPTYNRRTFVPRAIRLFQRQDYPRLELVIVDDGEDPVADCVPDDPRIRYMRRPPRLTIGGKRNLACAEARGAIIAHWDDDDWYPPHRIRVQVRALFDRPADVCGSSRIYYYEAATGRAWCYQYSGPNALWVAGNTLAYRRSYWERNPFADLQVGEDTHFVWGRIRKVVCDLADPSLCVAMIHPHNTARKDIGGPFWHPEPAATFRTWLDDDPLGNSPDPAAPLVSCIMPTRDRRPFLALSLAHFFEQDYPNKELIIIDDGADPVGDLAEGLPGVRYIRLTASLTIGGKRNLACREARGEFIAHWDDDDWYAPCRLSRQVAPLADGRADITGLENAYVLVLPAGEFWTITADLHRRMFVGDVHGGTLVYRKALFDQGVRFPEVNLAEDAHLIRQALRRGKRLSPLANEGSFVYVRHGRNAWQFETGRFLDATGWRPTNAPVAFSDKLLAAYRQAAAGVGAVSS